MTATTQPPSWPARFGAACTCRPGERSERGAPSPLVPGGGASPGTGEAALSGERVERRARARPARSRASPSPGPCGNAEFRRLPDLAATLRQARGRRLSSTNVGNGECAPGPAGAGPPPRTRWGRGAPTPPGPGSDASPGTGEAALVGERGAESAGPALREPGPPPDPEGTRGSAASVPGSDAPQARRRLYPAPVGGWGGRGSAVVTEGKHGSATSCGNKRSEELHMKWIRPGRSVANGIPGCR
ncbi:MAG: hypothetical protein LBT40_12080 [Deltaproteobacteria bacterium]|nr:hypothetical protein [Deltaproteobacteria bacterium]